MALFRKFFYKKPPDGLLEISEKVYVFDYCFTTEAMDEEEYQVYIRGIIEQLRDHFPDASYMVFNMREGDNQSKISNILCDYEMTVMDYPRQYEGCPLLTMEMIHHFLRSGENWLQLGLQNIILMHCERGGWPVLAFMLAALLIYRKQFTGEQKTLDMIYKQGSRELLQLMSPLNPMPSQLRYLQYISRRNVGSEWPPLDRALTLDCIIIRLIPNMDGEGGCRPIFRIYGQDPFMVADRTPKVLFSTPKRSKLVRYYKQDETELVKIDIHCHVQGDVVLECITLDNDLEREKMMFRVMFNTAFIRSNILMLNRDEIDMIWDIKEQFPKNFRVEVLFSDMEAASSVISIDLPRIDEKEGLPIEAFAKVKEIFSNVDWLDSKPDVANVLQQITATNILLEKLDGGASAATSSMLKEPLPGRLKFDSKTRNDVQSIDSPVQGKPSMSSFEKSGDGPMEKKLETSESMALPESNNFKTPAHMAQGNQPAHSVGLSQDLDSTKKEFKSLESLAQGKQSSLAVKPSLNESLKNETMISTSMDQGKQSTPLVESSVKESLENDTNICTSMAQGKQSTPSVEPSMMESSANDTKLPTSMAQGKQSTPLVESSMKESLESDAKLPTSVAQGKQSASVLDGKLPTSMSQGKQSIPLVELSMKEASESDTKLPTSVDQGKQSTLFVESSMKESSKSDTKPPTSAIVEPSMKESLKNDAKLPTSVAQGKQSTHEVEPLMKESSENDAKIATSMAQEKQSTPLAGPSMKESLKNDAKIATSTAQEKQYTALVEPSDSTIPTSMAQGKESTPLVEASMNENSVKNNFGSLESKERDTESSQSKTLLESVAQRKQSISVIQPSSDASSTGLESNKKDTESLESKEPLENDRKFKFEPQALPENDTRSETSAVLGKLSTQSFESSVDAPAKTKIDTLKSNAMAESNIKNLAPMGQATQPSPSFESSEEKKKELLESSAIPESNSKTLAQMGQATQPIPSLRSSKDSSSTMTQVESSETKALVKNDNKLATSMAQEKQSVQSIGPSTDANSMEKKVGPLESLEVDIQSLKSKELLENDAKFPSSKAQEKQSIPVIKPSTDANSTEKKTAPLESKESFKTETKGPMSTAQRDPSRDENSEEKKVGESEPTALSEADTNSVASTDQRKQHSPLLEPPIDVISVKKTELQDLRVGLQLPTQSKIISPRVHHALRSGQVSFNNSSPSSPGAISRYQGLTSALGITSVLQDHAPMDTKEEATNLGKSPLSGTMLPSDSKELKPVEPSSGSVPEASPKKLLPSSLLKPLMDPVAVIEKIASTTAPPHLPPPPPPGHEPVTNLIQSTATQHTENKTDWKPLLTPTPTPPPPPPPPSSTGQTLSSSIPPPPPLSGLRPSPASPLSLQLSFNNSAAMAAPPPPPLPPSSTSQTSSSSIPPPPPLSGLPSSASSPLSSQNKSAAMSGPPPPPPPPIPSSTTPGPTNASLAPPPPPPPFSSSKSSLPNGGPPVPPPPLPSASANGLSKHGTAPGPPPPGPPGGKGRSLLRANPRSQAQTKRSTLKPYHWLKITRVMQGSLWAETQKLDEVSRYDWAPEFDMSELETLFSAAAPPSDNGKGGKSNSRSQKPDKVQLIDTRRAYNCEIMLSKVKIPLPDLVSSVLALDESVLDVDQVENLIKFCPTKEEMETLKNYTGDKENLGKCEQFFLEQMKVPRVESKLRVFSFKIQFCTQVVDLRRNLNVVNNASEEIRNSVKLKRIMQTILSLGNALNHGTARGSAMGFRLDSLLKLTDTRSRNSKMTLMHYLCKVISEKLPELLEFPQDLVNLEAATKVQLKYLAEEMQAISKGLEKVVQELTASENDGVVSENFCQILKEFLSHAEAEVRCLAQLYANVGRNADALALYFGEDPARVPFEQVVSTLLNFVRMFVRAHEENCKQIEFEKKKAEKEAAENEKSKLKGSENMMRNSIKSEDII